MMCVIPSKKSLDRLGTALLKLGEDEQADDLAYAQLNHYRSLFHPLMTQINTQCQTRITKTLTKAKAKKSIVVQRIKRLESIILKLKRFETMQLSNMQDMGGVRVILPDIQALDLFTKGLFTRSKKIKIKNKKDYILEPKEDGYRGVHYQLELANKRLDVAPFEKLVVELQVRTMLQHCLATGVEIAGIINNRHYKTGDWDASWKGFFILLSDLFAELDKKFGRSRAFYFNFAEPEARHFLALIDSLNVIEQLRNVANLFSVLEKHSLLVTKEGYFLLITDFELQDTTIKFYTDEQEALTHLAVWERRFSVNKAGRISGQVLLIKSMDLKNLKEAYPNYYMDTTVLLQQIKLIIDLIKINLQPLQPL
jgi:putative GTP pyrophosphokinase